MESIVKAVALVIIELNIFYILGSGITNVKYLPEPKGSVSKMIYGYITYHFLFWCIAFPCSMLNQAFSSLYNICIGLFSVLIVVLLVLRRNDYYLQYKKLLQKMFEYRYAIIPFVCVVIFLAYYVSVNGRSDVDAQTYIAEITTMLDTDKLVGVRATHGQIVNKIDFRRSFAMYGAESAVWCNLFDLHPLIYSRIVRAILNVVVLAVVVLGLFLRVYKGKNQVHNALMAATLSLASLFLFRNTIYTSAQFILSRAYEGKAFCAGVLILIALYTTIEFVRERDNRYFVLFFMNMIMTMSISTSSVLIIPVVIGSIVGAITLLERKWIYIPRLVLSMLPNIVYVLILLSGVTYWRLW